MSEPHSFLRRARQKQIRIVARFFTMASRIRALHPILRAASVFEASLVGYRSAFASRAEAERCLAKWSGDEGHTHADAIRQHVGFSERARPSDYPMLLHLDRLMPTLKRVVDLGGSTGNLFYCYAKYLAFPQNMMWTVVDLEASLAEGRRIALERAEDRLHFAADLAGCDGADVVIISGALHFIDAMPPTLLAGWKTLPRHILINRSPVSESPCLYAIQDQGSYLTLARIIHRTELVRSMEQAGYRLVDEWRAPELHLRFPMHPHESVEAYSGFFFSRLDD